MSLSPMDALKTKFNPKQLEVLKVNNLVKPEILFLDGAMGSGKTLIQIIPFLNHVRYFKDKGYKFIMTGHTLGSLKRNVLDSITEMFGINTDLDKEGKFQLFGNTICCFGTDDSNSYKAIRGIMTAYGHYGNELTLSHHTAVKEVIGRCRGLGSRFFWEMNPADPSHSLYKNYIERWLRDGNTKELCRVNFTIYDNAKKNGGFLPDDYIRRMEEGFKGIWYRKYLLGEWCAIEGQIYYLEDLLTYDDDVTNEQNWFNGTIINGYLDPATGSRQKTGCFTSAITGARKGDNIYLLDAVVKKVMPNQVDGAIEEILKKRNFSVFAIEDNFSQDGYVVKPLQAKFPYIPIIGQSSREDKLSRLIGMHPIITQKVYFPKRWFHEKNSDGWLLLQQLCNVTKERTEKAETDETMLDAPDALEGLIRTFTHYSGGRIGAAGGDITKIKKLQEW